MYVKKPLPPPPPSTPLSHFPLSFSAPPPPSPLAIPFPLSPPLPLLRERKIWEYQNISRSFGICLVSVLPSAYVDMFSAI